MDTTLTNAEVAIQAIRQWTKDLGVGGHTEVFDLEHQEFMLVDNGWYNERRVYNVVIHISIKNDKFWVEQDRTEDGIASYLERLGIPKSRIVLGFYPLEHRKHTDYAPM
jgi:XisI protein